MGGGPRITLAIREGLPEWEERNVNCPIVCPRNYV